MKTYDIHHAETAFSATVQIDPQVAGEYVKEAVEFWGGWERRLAECDGDYTRCFLRQLGRKMVLVQLEHGFNVQGMVAYMNGEEGYPLMDGRHGIELTALDEAEVYLTDIIVEEA